MFFEDQMWQEEDLGQRVEMKTTHVSAVKVVVTALAIPLLHSPRSC